MGKNRKTKQEDEKITIVNCETLDSSLANSKISADKKRRVKRKNATQLLLVNESDVFMGYNSDNNSPFSESVSEIESVLTDNEDKPALKKPFITKRVVSMMPPPVLSPGKKCPNFMSELGGVLEKKNKRAEKNNIIEKNSETSRISVNQLNSLADSIVSNSSETSSVIGLDISDNNIIPETFSSINPANVSSELSLEKSHSPVITSSSRENSISVEYDGNSIDKYSETDNLRKMKEEEMHEKTTETLSNKEITSFVLVNESSNELCNFENNIAIGSLNQQLNISSSDNNPEISSNKVDHMTLDMMMEDEKISFMESSNGNFLDNSNLLAFDIMDVAEKSFNLNVNVDCTSKSNDQETNFCSTIHSEKNDCQLGSKIEKKDVKYVNNIKTTKAKKLLYENNQNPSCLNDSLKINNVETKIKNPTIIVHTNDEIVKTSNKSQNMANNNENCYKNVYEEEEFLNEYYENSFYLNENTKKKTFIGLVVSSILNCFLWFIKLCVPKGSAHHEETEPLI